MVNVFPVKASGFLRESLPEERQLLIHSGILPINDVFFPHFGNRSRIRLFYGGYGSGKSVFIAQDLIEKCLNDSYFKCYYGRKGYVDIRGSSFETIVETIEELGLESYFHYSKADNSSMVIKCRLNGNKFVPFGSDDPKKLKSIKDPTHIWCEEFDQYEDEDVENEKKGDFQLLFPRLRTTKAQTEFIASFNTEQVFPKHWILKYFFPEMYEGEDKPQDWFKEVIASFDILRVFANYTDNFFIDQEEYYKQLQLASGGDQDTLNSMAKGAWGIINNKKPWLYNYDQNKHVRSVLFLPTFPIYISFDFNVDPFACTIWQMSPQKGLKDSFIHCIDRIVDKVKLDDMCAIIKSRYPHSIKHVTGDRSGKNEDVGRNQTLYQMIQSYLGNGCILDLNDSNLEHADSRELCNALFYHYPKLYIDEKVVELQTDCKRATPDPNSANPSKLLKNRTTHKMDTFDSMRYFFQTYFHKFAKETYFRVINKR